MDCQNLLYSNKQHSVKIFLSLVFMFTVFSTNAQLKSLDQLLCTLQGTPSISIQQVDNDWNPAPFDCQNIIVLIEGEGYKAEIKYGQYSHCPSQVYKKYGHANLINSSVSVMGEKIGVFRVTVSRFNEVSTFKDVKIEQRESGCHTTHQLLEVQFDMTKQAKKQ